MMIIKKIAAAAALLAAIPAFASIATGNNGELALFVYDDVAKVSYAKDLGIFQDEFKAATDSFGYGASATAENGYTKSISISNDSFWTTFLASSTAANRQWTVVALDNVGGTAVNGVRIFTTAKNTAENLTNLGTWTNGQFTNATGSAQMGTLYDAVNLSGTHGTSGVALNSAVNGSSVNFDADNGNGFFGKPGSGATFNGNTTFSSGNTIGDTSSFYYVSRSSANQSLGIVTADLFANSKHGTQLSFTTTGGTPTLTISLATAVVTAVPEPSTYAMLFAGLVGIGFIVRRRNNNQA